MEGWQVISLGGLLASLLLGVVVPCRVLLGRRDPPVRLLAVVGPLLGLLIAMPNPDMPLRERVLASVLFCLLFWPMMAALLAGAVLLQGVSEGPPERPRWQPLEVGLLFCACTALVTVLPIPSLLAGIGLSLLGWRGGERAVRVRTELSVLLAAAIAGWLLLLPTPGPASSMLAVLGAPLLPLLGLPLLAWSEGGIPWRTLAWLGLPFSLWGMVAGLEVEASLRMARQLRTLDPSALPTSAFSETLPTMCVATPERPCPEGETLYFWPAQQPVGKYLASSSGAVWVAFQSPGGIGGVQVFPAWEEARDQGIFVTRDAEGGPEGVAAGGKPIEGAQGLLTALGEAKRACGLPVWRSPPFTLLDAAVDWTAAEIVELCSGTDCLLEREPSSCTWTEGRGFAVSCAKALPCVVAPQTQVPGCEGDCELELLGPVRVDCAQGCEILVRNAAVDLRCEGGGCVIRGATAATVHCPPGDCRVEAAVP